LPRHPHRKISPKKARWSVVPVSRADRDELAAGLLSLIDRAARNLTELKSELRRVRNAPERFIR
jgi:hypothetical protein